MSYDYSDLLMYSREVYLYYLRAYGEAFGNIRLIHLLVPLAIPVLVWNPSVLSRTVVQHRHRIVSFLIACFWTWIALAFHWTYFIQINYMAYGFTVLFLLEALLFFLFGTCLGRIEYRSPISKKASAGSLWICYMGFFLYFFSLLVVPAISWMRTGDLLHFGWTGGATALGTMGLVLLVRGPMFSYLLLPLPFLYAILSALRANAFELPEQYGLAAGCLLVLMGIIASHFQTRQSLRMQ